MNFKNIFLRDTWDVKISGLFKKFHVRNFTKTYFYQGKSTWANSSWLGVETLKVPTDLWVYQELICKLRPDFIIETGTWKGGSALYMASLCDALNHGKVITVDISPCDTTHPLLIKIVDDEGSTSEKVILQIQEIVKDSHCLVILDSTHRKQHVLDEMNLYKQFVFKDGYLIVEDTCLGGNPVLPSWGDGPMDAVKEFIKKNIDFEIDKSKEKFLLTFNPNGYLKRLN